MDALPYIDTLFKEYLLFRGFTKALQAFDADKKADKGCGFQAEQISNLVFGRLIPEHDSRGVVELLSFLRAQIFSRLPGDIESKASKLEASRGDCVKQFFTDYGEQLSQGPEAGEWEAWFVLPFLQKPQAYPQYQVYFTRPWRQLVEASFRNYLSQAVTQLPLPAVLRFNKDRVQRQALERKIQALQTELKELRSQSSGLPVDRQLSLDLDATAASQLKGLKSETSRTSSSWANLTAAATTGKPSSNQDRALSRIVQDKAVLDSRSAEPQDAMSPRQSATSQVSQHSRATGSTRHNPASAAESESRSEAQPQRTAETLLIEASDSEAGESQVLLDEPASARFEWPVTPQNISDAPKEGLVQDLNHFHSQRPNWSLPASESKTDMTANAGVGTSSAFVDHDRVKQLEISRAQPPHRHPLILEQAVLEGHEAAVSDVIFSPDGRNVASASADGVVRIWSSPMLGGPASRSAVLLCGDPVHRLAWDMRADKVMLMGTAKKGIKAWHLDTKRMIAHMRPDLAFPRVLDVQCSPTDPSFLCSTAGNNGEGRLSLWNLRAFKKVLSFKEDVRLLSISYAPNGQSIAATGDNGRLYIFDVNTATTSASVDLRQAKEEPSFVRFVGSNGMSVMTLSASGAMQSWDIAMLREPSWSMDVSCATASDGSRLQRFACQAAGTSAVLTSSSKFGYILSDLCSDEARLDSVSEHRAPISAIAWHPHDQIIITGSTDQTLNILRLMA